MSIGRYCANVAREYLPGMGRTWPAGANIRGMEFGDAESRCDIQNRYSSKRRRNLRLESDSRTRRRPIAHCDYQYI